MMVQIERADAIAVKFWFLDHPDASSCVLGLSRTKRIVIPRHRLDQIERIADQGDDTILCVA